MYIQNYSKTVFLVNSQILDKIRRITFTPGNKNGNFIQINIYI